MKRSIVMNCILSIAAGFVISIICVLTTIAWAGANDFHTGVRSGDAVYLESSNGYVDDSLDDDQSPTTLSKKEAVIVCSSNESGRICSNRSVSSDICIGSIASGVASQAFLSFNISQIPDNAVIDSVFFDLRSCTVTGEPFLTLNCLRAYPAFYSSLSPDDYFSGLPSGDIMKICSEKDLRNAQKNYPELAKALQDSVGSPSFQLRLQFDDLETVYAGMLNFGQQGKGWSTGKTEVVGESSGEWTPCLPKDTASAGSFGKSKSGKAYIYFDTIKMTVSYLS